MTEPVDSNNRQNNSLLICTVPTLSGDMFYWDYIISTGAVASHYPPPL